MASQLWNSRPNRSSKQWISKTKRQIIYRRDKYKCVYCRLHKPLLTLDHLVPRSIGGSHNSNNLVTACYQCNSARQTIPWEKYASTIARRYIRKEVLTCTLFIKGISL